MDYPSGDWKYCDCGESYYVYDDMRDGGICHSCREKRARARDREEKRVSKLERENKKLKASLKAIKEK